MKILLFTIEYPPFKGGVANYYENLVENWPEPGNISVLDNENDKLINNKIFPKWLPAVFRLWRRISKEKIEHVLVGQILPLGTAVFLLAKIKKISYTVFFHGMDFNFALRTKRKKWVTKKILEKSNNIICASGYTAELVENFIGPENADKISVVNPGIEPRAFWLYKNSNGNKIKELRAKHNLENKFVLFTIGRLVRRKGQDMAIKAVNKLNEKFPEICYYIAGTGPDKNYLEKLAKNNPNIEFLGNISEQEKQAWLRICDIFIMPNREIKGDFEGFGIVFLEAALAGKSVIAGRSGGTADAVIDYETGIFVNPESVDDIADGIVELKNSPTLRWSLGENAMNRTVCEFSWKTQADKIYNKIV